MPNEERTVDVEEVADQATIRRRRTVYCCMLYIVAKYLDLST
jgi:hypothetical protein